MSFISERKKSFRSPIEYIQLIERLCALVDEEAVLLSLNTEHEESEDDEDEDRWDFSVSCGSKWLIECLALCLEEEQFQVKWKSRLLSYQEVFLQGRMINNPYSSKDPSLGSLMRCHCEEDESWKSPRNSSYSGRETIAERFFLMR